MTHLGTIIRRILSERPKVTAAAIAEQAGVDRSYVSRIMHGRTGVSREVMAQIALALGGNTAERAEIIAAHMKDESCGYYPEFIKVITSGKSNASTDLHPDIEYLQSFLHEPGIRKALRGIVEVHRGSGKPSGKR